ncbi:MAG: hypothetical protein ACRDWA_10815 [Acidimicrobiia bacterium]
MSVDRPVGDRYSFFIVGTDSMPAPLLLPGRWVDALVDHGVPTVTLAYVTGHPRLLPSRRRGRTDGTHALVGEGSSGWTLGHRSARATSVVL